MTLVLDVSFNEGYDSQNSAIDEKSRKKVKDKKDKRDKTNSAGSSKAIKVAKVKNKVRSIYVTTYRQVHCTLINNCRGRAFCET